MLRADPIVAWRAWRVIETSRLTLTREQLERLAGRPLPPLEELVGWRLGAVAADHVWQNPDTGARVYTARCDRSGLAAWRDPDPAPPALRCGCGFWGVAEERDLPALSGHYLATGGGLSAVGRVEMWGRYVRHARGWRAQHARPLDITLLWQTRQVDVTAFGTSGREVLSCASSRAQATDVAAALAAYYRVPVEVTELTRWLADRGAA